MVRISELKFCITAGVQNTVAPRDQKLGVRERFFFYILNFMHTNAV